MRFLAPLLFCAIWVYALQMPNTMQADFKQTVTNEHGQKLQYTGSIYVDAPYDSKWSYDMPTQKDICISQESIIVVEHDLEQATYYKNSNHIDFNTLYKKAEPVSKNSYVTTFNDTKYHLQTKDGKIYSLEFTDALDNHSKISFSSVVYETKLPSLECEIPLYFDRIYE